MDHGELMARAKDDWVVAWWNDPAGWQTLIKQASVEDPSHMPASAAVWEAIWRVDPGLTPDAWATEGPRPPNVTEPLNPFLNLAEFTGAESVAIVAESDARAGALLEAAVQAEGVPAWWDIAEVLERYLTVSAESERFLADFTERTRLPYVDGREVPPALDSLDNASLPPNLLDDYEVALTRLLLIGHPPTTRQILPVVLPLQKTTDGATVLEQIRVTEFAMSRLRAGIPATGARTAVRTALGSGESRMARELVGIGLLDRPPGTLAMSRLTAAAAVLLGTLGTRRGRTRTKVGRRAQTRTKAGAPF